MHRVRAGLAALLVALLAIGPAAAGWPSGSAAQTKKTKSPASNKSVLDQIGSATTGFFKGVKDKLTPNRSPAKKSATASTIRKQPSKPSGASSSWFAGSQSKSTRR